MLKRVFVSVCLVLAFAVQGHAATINTFTSQASYNAAVGGVEFLIDFNGLPAGFSNGIFAGQVDFNTPDASNPANVAFGSDAMTDSGSTVAPNNVGFIEGVLANDAFAMSMDILSGSIAGFKLFKNGAEIAMVNLAAGGFVGLVSDMAFDKFQLIPNVFVTTGGNDRIFIDNFQVNAPAPVPVPAALPLLAGGLGLLGFLGWRKRKSAAI